MATSVTDSTSTTATTSNTVVSNPGATLDKDAFLKLLLIELQHQDPTEPMDSDKMLTQTSQLSALEMQQNTNTTMQQMVETMNQLSTVMVSNANMALLGAVGKMAVVDTSTITVSSQGEKFTDIKMYLPKATTEAGLTLEVMDSSGKVIKSIKVEQELSAGTQSYEWDGTKDDGSFAGAGEYTVRATYKDVDGGTSVSNFGSYPIESIKFEDGVAKFKLAGQYITADKVVEITA